MHPPQEKVHPMPLACRNVSRGWKWHIGIVSMDVGMAAM
jgi:hypothetical protein